MLHFAAVIAVLTVYLASLWGWGRPLLRALPTGPHGNREHGWAFSALLGLCLWALIGGLLNLTHLVRPAALDALVLVGLLIGGIDLARHRLHLPHINAASLSAALPIVIVWGSTLFLAANLLPAGVLNHADDMQKYVVRPMQMLTQGALGQNPFDTLGHHSLGLQSFFHSLILNHFSLLYLVGFDQVLCYLLAGLLVNDLGCRVGAGPWLRSLAMVTMVAVDPQWVNISSVYSSTLLVVGLAYVGLLLFNVPDGQRKGAIGVGLLVGVLIAFLGAIKLTMAPYAIGFVGLLFTMALFAQPARRVRPTRKARRRLLQAAVSTTVGTTLFALPWMLSYRHNYISTLNEMIQRSLGKLTVSAPVSPQAAGTHAGQAALDIPVDSGPLAQLAQLFSDQVIYFGHHFIAYGAVVLLALVCGVIAAVLMRRWSREYHAALAVAIAASVTAATFYLLIPFVFGISYKGVRYLCPVLVPLLPICAMIIAGGPGALAPRNAPSVSRWFGTPVVIVAIAAMVLVSALFTERLVARSRLLYHLNAAVAFPLGPFNLAQHHYAFLPKTRQRLRNIQGLTPPGSTLLVRTTTPFHLNFDRNRIFTMPEADFSASQLGLMATQGPEALRQKMLSYGVNYVLWKYTNPNLATDNTDDAAKSLDPYRAKMLLAFDNKLKALVVSRIADRQVLFDDGNTILFSLAGRRSP